MADRPVVDLDEGSEDVCVCAGKCPACGRAPREDRTAVADDRGRWSLDHLAKDAVQLGPNTYWGV